MGAASCPVPSVLLARGGVDSLADERASRDARGFLAYLHHTCIALSRPFAVQPGNSRLPNAAPEVKRACANLRGNSAERLDGISDQRAGLCTVDRQPRQLIERPEVNDDLARNGDRDLR